MTRPVGKHLTHEEHAEIRRRLATGEAPTKIAADIGCRKATAWKIRRAMLAATAGTDQPADTTKQKAEAPPADSWLEREEPGGPPLSLRAEAVAAEEPFSEAEVPLLAYA